MLRLFASARKDVVVDCASPVLQPRLYAGSSSLKQLELDRPAGLLLDNRGPRPDPTTAEKLANPDFDDVAAAQLAVDGKVEQSSVAKPSFSVEPKPYRPYLLRL